MKSGLVWRRASCTAVLLAAIVAAHAKPPAYRVLPLQGLSDRPECEVTRINERGQAVGGCKALSGLYFKPVVWDSDGSVTAIDWLPGDYSGMATAINARGVVAGDSFSPRMRARAFVWDAERGTRSMSDTARVSSPVALTDDGHVLVTARSSSGSRAWAYAAIGSVAGRPVVVAPQTRLANYGVDLNERGQVLVRAGSAPQYTALVEHDGSAVVLPTTPSTFYTIGAALNNLGQVVGRRKDGADHAFLWDPASGMRDLGVLGEQAAATAFSEATDINDLGQVVGWSWGDAQTGFYCDDTNGMLELATLLAAADPLRGRFTLGEARSINRDGWIAAHGARLDGAAYGSSAVLMIPLGP